MASEDTEGTLSEENVLPQEPAKVADQLAAAESLPADTASPVREDQIQNAINFLSHPKVRGSSKEAKVSFLEKKGLTSVEIDEAFRRLPESTSGGSSTPVGQSQGRQVLAKPFPTPAETSIAPYSPLQPPQQQPLRWTQVVVGASAVAVGVYALKHIVGPYAVMLYRRMYGYSDTVAKEEREKEKEEEQKTAHILASAIQSQTSELRSAIESLKDMVKQLDKSQQLQEPVASPEALSISDLRQELQSFAATLKEDNPHSKQRSDGVERELRELRAVVTNRNAERPFHSSAHYPSSPSQPYQSTNGFISVTPPAARVSHKQESPTQDAPPSQPQHAPSYMEVLEMLERGETPPNVRTDINDQPPNPSQPPPSTRLQPKPKPWERSRAQTSNAYSGGNGDYHHGPHTTITEITEQPATSKPASDPWRPPPIPQASLKKSLPASSVSSTVGDEDEAS